MTDPRLDRILHGPGTDPDDERLRRACAAAAARLRALALPPLRLPGWVGLCSGGYTAAAEDLHRQVGNAWSACVSADRP